MTARGFGTVPKNMWGTVRGSLLGESVVRRRHGLELEGRVAQKDGAWAPLGMSSETGKPSSRTATVVIGTVREEAGQELTRVGADVVVEDR
jgi:hypothetical protein